MSFELDLNLGEAFAQIRGNGPTHAWYLPRRSLIDGLKDALGERLPEGGVLRVSTNRLSDLSKISPSATAVTTAGFESLLTLLDADSVFASSARTAADGSITVAVNQPELQTLTEKLKILNASSVAVCFLHSLEFPAQEKQVAEYLESNGFTVFSSYVEDGNERERFTSAQKKAVQFAWLNETAAQLQTALSLLGEWTVVAATPIATLLPQSVLHLGFESFDLTLKSGGPRALRVQPTQRLMTGVMGAPTLAPAVVSFGSGPLFLGRSVHATVLDLLFALDQLDEVETFKTTQGPRLKSRVFEMLLTSAKEIESEYRIEAASLAHDLLALTLELIGDECVGAGPLLVTGGLAPALTPLLLKQRRGLELTISAEVGL